MGKEVDGSKLTAWQLLEGSGRGREEREKGGGGRRREGGRKRGRGREKECMCINSKDVDSSLSPISKDSIVA